MKPTFILPYRIPYEPDYNAKVTQAEGWLFCVTSSLL